MENRVAEAMETFFATYIISPDFRLNGKTITEIALIWFLKDRSAMWRNARKALEDFGKIIDVDMDEKLEYLGDYYAPKPYETLMQFLQRTK